MATKRDGDPCYEKAGMDEPIFVLRAQDKLAADTIRYWIDNAIEIGVPLPKTQEAARCAAAMDRWHTHKDPD